MFFHLAGVPDRGLDFSYIGAQLRSLQTAQIAAVIGAIVVLGVVSQPLQFELLRLFEGYWNYSWPGVYQLYHWGIKRHQRRRQALVEVMDPPYGKEPGTPQQVADASDTLRLHYPDQDRILPTRLGNVLRAAEDRAGTRYGLETIVVWPQLYIVMPIKIVGILDEQRNQLDLSVRMCAVLSSVALFESLALILHPASLFDHPLWLASPVTILALAIVAYRSSIRVSLAYGRSIENAFDLYRFDLLKALHLPLPQSRLSELRSNQKLSEFLATATSERAPHRFFYDHDIASKSETDGG